MTTLERLLRGDPATCNGSEIVQTLYFPELPRDIESILIISKTTTYANDWYSVSEVNEYCEEVVFKNSEEEDSKKVSFTLTQPKRQQISKSNQISKSKLLLI